MLDADSNCILLRFYEITARRFYWCPTQEVVMTRTLIAVFLFGTITFIVPTPLVAFQD